MEEENKPCNFSIRDSNLANEVGREAFVLEAAHGIVLQRCFSGYNLTSHVAFGKGRGKG
jgi:hypothetical protein